jgi:hypothetical protein
LSNVSKLDVSRPSLETNPSSRSRDSGLSTCEMAGAEGVAATPAQVVPVPVPMPREVVPVVRYAEEQDESSAVAVILRDENRGGAKPDKAARVDTEEVGPGVRGKHTKAKESRSECMIQ